MNFAIQPFTTLEVLLGTIGHRLEMLHSRQQQPDDLFVLSHDADIDGPHRMVLDPPHIVPVVDVGFLGAAIDLGHLIGRKFQRLGLNGAADEEAQQ